MGLADGIESEMKRTKEEMNILNHSITRNDFIFCCVW